MCARARARVIGANKKNQKYICQRTPKRNRLVLSRDTDTTTFSFGSLSMFLGFYVSYVSNRWWSMYCAVPYIDACAQTLRAVLGADSPEALECSTRCVKYCLFCYLLTCRACSAQVCASVQRQWAI